MQDYQFMQLKPKHVSITKAQEKKKIMFLDNDPDLLNACKQLCDISSVYECVGAHNMEDQTFISEPIIRIKPQIVVMSLENLLTFGISTIKFISPYYRDIKIQINAANATSANLANALNDKYNLVIVNIEQMLSILLEDLKKNYMMPPDIMENIVSYYNLNRSLADNFNITYTEKRVLKMLVDGNSYKTIAGIMNISFQTVKTHVRNLYKKLEVHNISSAITKAYKYNLVKG
jgi:DNA-binding NarL/FixJ family response regulator